jgi:hypothetical protein
VLPALSPPSLGADPVADVVKGIFKLLSSNRRAEGASQAFQIRQPSKEERMRCAVIYGRPLILQKTSQPSHRNVKKAGTNCFILPHGRGEKQKAKRSNSIQSESAAADMQLHSGISSS